ncbi:BAG family molecular chaperone regulator 1 [Geodia barretti]|uniref:BAG family molecular chaperone regulator 1 n=1 Tax=Geodia barretti TaxID=519541 RepID=A0AA35T4Y5_GEOBA|nr:BAG family molecular chaperone regulator 1 [Geodia barretti]
MPSPQSRGCQAQGGGVSSGYTVGQLQEALEELTEVPVSAQKLIFQGKTLRDESKTLSGLSMKQDSKLILLGRKASERVLKTYTDDQEEQLRPITAVLKTVDSVKKKLDAISEEIEGIEKGFVQRELVGEACRGLHKRCVAATELLMRSMEALDSIVRH